MESDRFAYIATELSMDDTHFEQICRGIQITSRRHVVVALVTGFLSAALSPSRAIAAKHRKHKNKNKGKCGSDWACPIGELCKGGRC